jgi:hypothetical protein
MIISGLSGVFSAEQTEPIEVKRKKITKKVLNAACRFILFSFGCTYVGLRRVRAVEKNNYPI